MTEPAGCISLAQHYLRQMLANCAAVRTWLGVDDEEGALARIHHEGLPKPADNAVEHTRAELIAYRPYAVVFTAESGGLTLNHDAGGAAFEFAESGRLTVRLYQNCPDEYGDEPSSDANLQFKNSVGLIMDGLAALSGTAGYLAFDRLGLADGPYWGHPDLVPGQGVWQGAELSIEWGEGA